jgi:hypothetical protein
LEYHEKTESTNHGHRKTMGQAKEIENMFNKVIAENFPNHEEGTDMHI